MIIGDSSSQQAVPVGNDDDLHSQEEIREERPNASRRRKKQYAVSTRWEREIKENKKKCCTGTPQDLNNLCCCCFRQVGGMHFLVERADGSPIFVAGPCWPFCLCFTVPLIIGLSGLVAYFVILKKGAGLPKWFAFIYLPLVAFTLAALCGVSCRNPGLLERVTDEEAASGGWYWNEQVGSYRPPDATYCRECKVLIQEYDHLCPWTGTGIGKGNMACFKIFVVSVNVLCYSSMAIVAYALLKDV